MGKIMMNSMEILILVGLIYGLLRYWKWKLMIGYDVLLENRAFGIFMTGQVLTLLIILVSSIDPQNSSYLESLSWFGKGAMDYWTVIGVKLFGIVILYMLANVAGHLLIRIVLTDDRGLYDEIRNENNSVALIVSVCVLAVGFISSSFVLKPYIFDWISSKAGLVPLF
jgi:uncharacterized membrane protein YjfL (UPF0719 family)